VGKQRPGEILFAVTDSGIGISAEQLPRLFQKFSQADSSTTRRYGGTGLGLAISKRLVELMGGRIGVTSRAGEGSTFWFALPRHDVAEEPVSRPATSRIQLKIPPLRIDGRAPRVLVVDDIPINREVALSALTLLGCVSTVATNGHEAIAAWEAGGIDAVLMDCLMPELDGWAATRRIRELEDLNPGGRRTPIIAVTANAMPEDREKSHAAGMDAFLAKPLRTADIRNALAPLLVADGEDSEQQTA
jgi:CheY-like chemotaxis protein